MSEKSELEALRAEVAALQRKLRFLQGAVDALPFPMFWKDAQSVYVGGNLQQATRAGLPSADALEGLADTDLPWTPEESAGFRADDQRVMATGEASSQIIETQHTSDQAQKLCQTHKAPLRDASGGVMGVVGWYEDITDREEQARAQTFLDERLKKAHKLDALGVLAGGIAHDFNNILATILANLGAVRALLSTEHPAEESLADIEAASVRAIELVKQILTMSRQEGPQSHRPVSLGEVVLEVGRLLRAALPAGIELGTDVEPDVPAILADAAQLHQVVMNLCTNAKYALADRPSASARIDVRVSRRALDAAGIRALAGQLEPGVFAVLTVSDNGVGMDARTLERILEPFFTTRVVGQGPGLGLAVVHGIVTAHRGAIALTSSPGKGTTVRIYFPASTEPAKASVKPAPSPSPGTKLHLLYVDDEIALTRVVTRVLERAGCRVTVFTDPREALAALRKEPASFDLLAADYNMPHLSGLDLAREARQLRLDLPVVIASGFITAELRNEAVRLGVWRVFEKTSLVSDLREAMRVLAQRGQE